MSQIFTIRASSWGALFDCSMRWEGIHLLGMNSGPASGRLRLGTALHASTALYDQGRVEGASLTPDDAAGALVDALRDHEQDVVWEDIALKDAERIGLALHAEYCTVWSPRWEFAAVELSVGALDIDVPEHDITIRATGTLDRSRAIKIGDGSKLQVADLKSGARAVSADGTADTKGHHLQLGIYDLAYEFGLGVPTTGSAEVIGLNTGGKPRVGIGRVDDVRRPLVGDETHPGLVQVAAQMARAGLFPPNPKSLFCGERYCPRHRKAGGDCIYHQ